MSLKSTINAGQAEQLGLMARCARPNCVTLHAALHGQWHAVCSSTGTIHVAVPLLLHHCCGKAWWLLHVRRCRSNARLHAFLPYRMPGQMAAEDLAQVTILEIIGQGG